MQFTIFVLALAGMAAAGPAAKRSPQLGLGQPSGSSSQGSSEPDGNTTVGQAIDACGNNLELNCCNTQSQQTDGNGLAGILNGLTLFQGCSKLDVSALIGVEDLLNSQCKQNVACCQRTSSDASGLVAVGLPCIALGSLL